MDAALQFYHSSMPQIVRNCSCILCYNRALEHHQCEPRVLPVCSEAPALTSALVEHHEVQPLQHDLHEPMRTTAASGAPPVVAHSDIIRAPAMLHHVMVHHSTMLPACSVAPPVRTSRPSLTHRQLCLSSLSFCVS